MRVHGSAADDERVTEPRQQLLAAGLELLGSPDGPLNFTVHGVCREAGLTTRHFYDSFDNLDEFAIAIYDEEITSLTIVTMDALEGVDRGDDEQRVRTSLAALIGHIAQDRRRGQLLYSATLASLPAVVERRRESTRLFVGLLVDEANPDTQLDAPSDVVSEMLVGGLAQAIKAWLDADLTVSQAELVDACTRVFLDTLAPG